MLWQAALLIVKRRGHNPLGGSYSAVCYLRPVAAQFISTPTQSTTKTSLATSSLLKSRKRSERLRLQRFKGIAEGVFDASSMADNALRQKRFKHVRPEVIDLNDITIERWAHGVVGVPISTLRWQRENEFGAHSF